MTCFFLIKILSFKIFITFTRQYLWKPSLIKESPDKSWNFLISSCYNLQAYGSFKTNDFKKKLKIFIFLYILLINLILTKHFGNLSPYINLYIFTKPFFSFLLGVFFWLHHSTPRVSYIKFSLKQYFPDSSMDNQNVQSKSDKLQRKHDQVKERLKHSCVQPCAICCLFIPGQKFINQQKKKEDDKN